MPCEETRRYVQNYMGVVDTRPVADEDLVKGEDELHSDEDWIRELSTRRLCGRRTWEARPWRKRTGGPM
eukprot:4245791-Pyramimonas_sp.AAC.1